MQITQSEFQYMLEGITTDLIVMLIMRKGYTTEQAVKAVYASHVYKSLQNPTTALYFQSPGYIYNYLNDELVRNENNNDQFPTDHTDTHK